MIELDRQALFVMVGKTLAIYQKSVQPEVLAAWYRALKDFSLSQVQNALDQHVKFGRYAPRPGDIVRRINGKDDKGDTKEGSHMPAMDRRCVYEQNDVRCPAVTSSFTFGNRGYCHDHERHQSDPVHMQRILDDLVQNGVPFEPRTPHRQRAEYLYAKGGPELVLAGVTSSDGSRWGPYDQRMVDWLRAHEADGGVKPWSYVSPHNPPKTVAEATRFSELPEDELAF